MLKPYHKHILDKELVPYTFLMLDAREMKSLYSIVIIQQTFIVDIMKMLVSYVKNLNVMLLTYVLQLVATPPWVIEAE